MIFLWPEVLLPAFDFLSQKVTVFNPASYYYKAYFKNVTGKASPF